MSLTRWPRRAVVSNEPREINEATPLVERLVDEGGLITKVEVARLTGPGHETRPVNSDWLVNRLKAEEAAAEVPSIEERLAAVEAMLAALEEASS